MAEIWGAAIAVGGAVISGMAAEKKAKQDRANANADRSAMNKEESAYAAQRTGYEMALENYYKDKDRYERQRGLDQFRQFSTMHKWAPNADDSGGRLSAPVMPNYNEFAVVEQNSTAGPGTATPGRNQQSGGTTYGP